MPPTPEFDLEKAHKYFASQCFNQAWDLIEKADRTPEENLQMIRLNQASVWHWTQRPDCTSQNLSVGYWQASRIYALLGQADNARIYGQLALDQSDGLKPFYVAYAYEALARAEMVAGNKEKMQKYAETARKLAAEVRDADSKTMLVTDLETLSGL